MATRFTKSLLNTRANDTHRMRFKYVGVLPLIKLWRYGIDGMECTGIALFLVMQRNDVGPGIFSLCRRWKLGLHPL